MIRRLLLIFAALACFAARPHSVVLTWTDTVNVGATYSVYRTSGLCSGPSSYSRRATGLTLLTWTDTPISAGSYCYYVTASIGSAESVPSNLAAATVPGGKTGGKSKSPSVSVGKTGATSTATPTGPKVTVK